MKPLPVTRKKAVRNDRVAPALLRQRSGVLPVAFRAVSIAAAPYPIRYAATPIRHCRCAIVCLERALDSKMRSLDGRHGNRTARTSQAGVLSVLAFKGSIG